jgi:hypothetical protein
MHGKAYVIKGSKGRLYINEIAFVETIMPKPASMQKFCRDAEKAVQEAPSSRKQKQRNKIRRWRGSGGHV